MSNFKDLVNIVQDNMCPIILHIPDTNGSECRIGIREFLKMLRILTPDDKLWEENKL